MAGEEGGHSKPGQLDLNTLVHQGELEVSIKPAESENDGRARRLRETVTFLIAVGMVALVFLTCLGLLLFGHTSADEQRWLQSALTLIVGAAVGAAFKKT
jgi:hypothetical protein